MRMEFEAIAALKIEGLGATEIAKRLGIGRASVYRVSVRTASPTGSGVGAEVM